MYNTLSSQSLVFEYAYHGNVKGIQDLFKNQEASPFDRDEWGSSLLFVCLSVSSDDEKG